MAIPAAALKPVRKRPGIVQNTAIPVNSAKATAESPMSCKIGELNQALENMPIAPTI